MPLYEYQCKKCHQRFERIRKFSDPPVTKCPECGGKVEQLLSAPAVQFKGSGWYVTDYGKGTQPKPSGGDDSSRGETTTGEAPKSSDTAKSEDKPKFKPGKARKKE